MAKDETNEQLGTVGSGRTATQVHTKTFKSEKSRSQIHPEDITHCNDCNGLFSAGSNEVPDFDRMAHVEEHLARVHAALLRLVDQGKGLQSLCDIHRFARLGVRRIRLRES